MPSAHISTYLLHSAPTAIYGAKYSAVPHLKVQGTSFFSWIETSKSQSFTYPSLKTKRLEGFRFEYAMFF